MRLLEESLDMFGNGEPAAHDTSAPVLAGAPRMPAAVQSFAPAHSAFFALALLADPALSLSVSLPAAVALPVSTAHMLGKFSCIRQLSPSAEQKPGVV